MAPNFTMPNPILVESPLDLTMSPNSDLRKKSSYQEMRVTSRRMPISHCYAIGKGKSHDGISPFPKAIKKDLGLICHEQLSGKVQSDENNIDSLAEKRKHVARKWARENLHQTNKTVSAIYTLIAAYSLFCRENGEQPVSVSAFLDIINTEFSEQSSQNDSSASPQKKNYLARPKSPASLLNQKRKLAAYAEDDLRSAGIFEKRQRNLRATLEQRESLNQLAVSKYLKLNADDVSDNASDSVDLCCEKKENLDGSSKNLKVEILKQHEEQRNPPGKKSMKSLLKGTQAAKDDDDSDSSDLGCEEIQTIASHDNTLLCQNEVNIDESDSSPVLKFELHERTFLEFGNESCDSGLESFDSDSDKQSDSDYDSQPLQYLSDDKKCESDSSHNDEEELGSLVIDENDSGNSSTQSFTEDSPRPVEIKEELLLDEDASDEVTIRETPSRNISNESLRDSRIKVISNVVTLLNLKEFSDSICFLDARKLSDVFVQMLNNNLLGLFLQIFGHSMSCKARQCSKLCFMFKRIMKHLTSASMHKCAVKHIYGHILRLHIDTCKDINCGILNCKLLRGKRLDKRSDHLASLG